MITIVEIKEITSFVPSRIGIVDPVDSIQLALANRTASVNSHYRDGQDFAVAADVVKCFGLWNFTTNLQLHVDTANF